jgi:S-DNA-T family DNA segregation ATPase FtsK/SpoIIIE
MILRLTVHDPGTDARCDVEVSAEAETPLASVLDALPLPIAARPCFVADQRLDPREAVGDSPLTHGAVISIGAPGPAPRSAPQGAVGALRVLDGHDTGLVSWLEPGRHPIGRSAHARVVMTCDEVSREHALLTVSVSGVAAVEDLDASSGTFIDGHPLAGNQAAALPPGSLLEVGTNLAEWVPMPPRQARLRTVRSRDGRLDFDPAFAAAPAPRRTQVELPAAPARHTAARGAMWITALAPVVVGLVLFAFIRNPIVLAMCGFGPVSMIGTRFADKRQRAADEARFEAEKAASLRQIADLVAAEEKTRRAQSPDLVDVILAATGTDHRAWPRNADSPDGLRLRVGVTSEPASIDVRGQRWDGFAEPTLHGVPLTVDLRTAGVLGVTGPPAPAAQLARWLLVQLGVLRSPDDLRIVLITSADGGGDGLSWASWLPHTEVGEAGPMPCWVGNTEATRAARIAELRDLIAIRLAERRSAGGGRGAVRFAEDVVVLLDGALALRNLPGMKTILRDGPEAGVYVIAVDRRGMNECRAECAVDDDLTVRLTPGRGEQVVYGRGEGIGVRGAERLARAVAPLRDRLSLAAAKTAIPHRVRFLDLLGVAAPTAKDVLALWARAPGPTMRVPLGADGDGQVDVDLLGQGPHTMLGGATGAGKSILLQTLVTSLLLANTPEEMNLVLVDFKGGGAFLPFERCPHVVALIRSTGETAADVFDEAAADRVLASVRAEVRRRESLLARYGGEIDAYWRARRTAPAMPALPRLLMIFDGFARVFETSPNFLRELVNVAAKGRSLGMHLVLATQSLQGKLSAELKNNIDLRITLRQNEPADSIEVLGVPDAATIPRLPGRGMILCTKDETRTPRLFQSGYLGDPPPVGGARPARVRILDWVSLGIPRPEDRPHNGGAVIDQTLTVRAVEDAARRLGPPAPFRPLLPPLPAEIPLLNITVPHPDVSLPTGSRDLKPIVYGIEDRPGEQSRCPATLDLTASGHLLVAGAPRSGRSQLLRTLASAAARQHSSADIHLYGIDCGDDALLGLTELPHCGAVVTRTQPRRVIRLLGRLTSAVRRRQELLAEGGFAGIAEQRQAVSARQRLPHLMLLIDRWESFIATLGDIDSGGLVEEVFALLRDGGSVGVHVVLAGDRSLLMGRVSTLVEEKLVLRLAERADFGLAGINPRVIPANLLPGRAFRAGSGVELQVALLDGEPTASGQSAVLAALGAMLRSRDAELPLSQRPFRIDELPFVSDRFHVGDAQGRPVGREDVLAWLRDRHATGASAALLGPRRAGKSWVLAELSRRLVDDGSSSVHPVVVPQRSLSVGTPDALAKILDRRLDKKISPAGELLDKARSRASTMDRLVFLLDEVGRLIQYHPAAVSWLRDLGQAGAWLVYTGTEKDWHQVVRWALTQPGSSFGNDVNARILGALAERPALTFLNGTAANLGVALEPTRVGEAIIELVGTWPFYLQVVGDAVVRAAQANDLRPLSDRQALNSLVELRLLDEWSQHFQARWAEIEIPGRAVLLEAPLPAPQLLTPAQRNDLRDVGLLRPGDVWLSDRPFFKWITRNAKALDDGGYSP